MVRKILVTSVWGVCALGVMAASAGAGEMRLKDGRWRFELQGMHGISSGGGDRGNDWYIVGQIEYEIPAWQRWTFGPKLTPLFIMDQTDSDEGTHDTVFGVGVGLSARVYQHAESRHGLFAEAGISALLHSPEIEDNSSNVNFITEVGVGYRWRNYWHAAVKFNHISNASLGKRNSGFNAVGLAVGKTF